MLVKELPGSYRYTEGVGGWLRLSGGLQWGHLSWSLKAEQVPTDGGRRPSRQTGQQVPERGPAQSFPDG